MGLRDSKLQNSSDDPTNSSSNSESSQNASSISLHPNILPTNNQESNSTNSSEDGNVVLEQTSADLAENNVITSSEDHCEIQLPSTINIQGDSGNSNNGDIEDFSGDVETPNMAVRHGGNGSNRLEIVLSTGNHLENTSAAETRKPIFEVRQSHSNIKRNIKAIASSKKSVIGFKSMNPEKLRKTSKRYLVQKNKHKIKRKTKRLQSLLSLPIVNNRSVTKIFKAKLAVLRKEITIPKKKLTVLKYTDDFRSTSPSYNFYKYVNIRYKKVLRVQCQEMKNITNAIWKSLSSIEKEPFIQIAKLEKKTRTDDQ